MIISQWIFDVLLLTKVSSYEYFFIIKNDSYCEIYPLLSSSSIIKEMIIVGI